MTMRAPPGFEPISFRRLPRNKRRLIWRAVEKAHKLDCEFFDRNATWLTRVREAIEGELPNMPQLATPLFVVVLQIRPGKHHKELFTARSPTIGLQGLDRAIEELAVKVIRPSFVDLDTRKQNAVRRAWLLAGAPIEGRA
jgi:hypothetical protein